MAENISWVVIPPWYPIKPTGIGDLLARAIIYFLAMCYIFLGVSIIADRFMAAIEVITSKEKEVKIKRVTGVTYTILVRVWNETVSNLSLMALGSSAPEILLSIIEIVGNDFNEGELGPGTIVGSAAFNLFVIIAICVQVIPSGEVRRIKHVTVFWVTATWSIFAYIWLYLIIARITPGVIDLWEALVTLGFFPVTVFTAYVADRNMFGFLGKRYTTVDPTSFVRPGTGQSRKSMHVEMGTYGDTEAMAFEENRQRYIEIFKRLRTENPEAPISVLEKLAEQQLLKTGPKSRAFYRIQATRKLVGAGDITNKRISKKQPDRHTSAESGKKTKEDDQTVTVTFEPGHYTCMEDVGTMYLTVHCDRKSVNQPCIVRVDYATENGSANAGDDYKAERGMLLFKPKDTNKKIGVPIIDNDIYEDDEHFFVRLSNPRIEATNAEGQPTRVAFGDDDGNKHALSVKLGTPSVATVLIVDNDHAGAFGFQNELLEVPESTGQVVLKVCRTRGARGVVSVPFKTVDGTAKAGRDYTAVDGVLFFADEQSSQEIIVDVMNMDDYEKSEDFHVELGDPTWEDPPDELKKQFKKEKRDSGNASASHGSEPDGRPIKGPISHCKVVIKENKEFKTFVDKMLNTANSSIVVGSSSWKQQFIEAITLDASNEDDDADTKTNATCAEYVMHVLTVPWKLLFALVPPTDYLNGWVCFVVSIAGIGAMTAVIGDLASHFGRTVGLKDAITAITFVAMGTSVPDTFASKVAAVQDKHADSSVGNVTGSNAVNVFLGIGVAWTIAAVYHKFVKGDEFTVTPGSLAFSVTLFCVLAVITILVLQARRYIGSINGELGGPFGAKLVTSLFLVSLWVCYIVMSILVAYDVIKAPIG